MYLPYWKQAFEQLAREKPEGYSAPHKPSKEPYQRAHDRITKLYGRFGDDEAKIIQHTLLRLKRTSSPEKVDGLIQAAKDFDLNDVVKAGEKKLKSLNKRGSQIIGGWPFKEKPTFHYSGRSYPVIPWVDLGSSDAWEDGTDVIIATDEGFWYGPYSSPALATRTAWKISTKGDNTRNRVPIKQMHMIKKSDWPMASGLSSKMQRAAWQK